MASKKPTRIITPEELLRDYHPEIRAIAEALRALVKNLVPEANEQVYTGWRALGYRHPSAGYFCGIFPHQEEVHLLFEWGVLLPDPDGILAGEAAQVRYIPIDDIESIHETTIEKLIRTALELPESNVAKKQMAKNLIKGR